jgi:hypothetical protein
VRAALAAVALLLAGCTGGEVVDAEPPVVQEAPSPADPHGDLTCDGATLDGLVEAIDGQLAAFAQGDFAAALSFASERFRSANTPEQFQATIEADYPLLIGASGQRPGTCVAQGGTAQLVVTIEGDGGQRDELVYLMTLEDGEWRIEAAGRVPSEEPVPV